MIAGPVHALYADELITRRELIVPGVALATSCPVKPMFYLNSLLDASYRQQNDDENLRITNRHVFDDVNDIS